MHAKVTAATNACVSDAVRRPDEGAVERDAFVAGGAGDGGRSSGMSDFERVLVMMPV